MELTGSSLSQIEAALERVADAIAETGLSRTLREKLQDLERRRDELEVDLRTGDPETDVAAPIPRTMDRWRTPVDGMENLAAHPNARPGDLEEAREHLSNLLGHAHIVPENGQLVAEVGFESLEIQIPARGRDSYIRVVAGAGFEPATFGL